MSIIQSSVMIKDPPWESTNCLVRADASVSEKDIGQSLTFGFASHISQIGPTYVPSFFPWPIGLQISQATIYNLFGKSL